MKKILFITTRLVNVNSTGGHQCTKRNYDSLCNLYGTENIEVINLLISHNEVNLTHKLVKWINLINLFSVGLTKDKLKYIIHRSKSNDMIFFDGSLYGVVAKKIKAEKLGIMIVTFYHNAEFNFRKPKNTYKIWLYAEYLVYYINEFYSCKYSDLKISLNLRDKISLQNKYNYNIDQIIPMSLKDTFQEKTNNYKIRNKPLLLFIGSNFPPNKRGIMWFIENVFPVIEAKLLIIGCGLDDLNKKSSNEDITTLDFTADISTYITEADLMIMPIFEGSGMKVKTCEALMYGKHIVATSEAFCGYEVDYDKVGALCNTKEDFIFAINRLSIGDKRVFNLYSRETFLQKYSFHSTLEQFKII